MAEKVDLSLDDIIKMNKKKNQRTGGGSGMKPKKRLQNLGSRSKVLVIKKGGPKNLSSPKREATMLHVSNLHFNVSNEDIRELFAEVGPIKKATVHYDKSGRSLGTAEVIFSTRETAIKAIKKYNNLPLDGRPMIISLVPSKTSVSSPNKIGLSPRRKTTTGVFKRQPQQNTRNNNNNQKKRGGPAPRGGRVSVPRGKQGRQPKKQVTAEQLDADLEAYTTHSMDVN